MTLIKSLSESIEFFIWLYRIQTTPQLISSCQFAGGFLPLAQLTYDWQSRAVLGRNTDKHLYNLYNRILPKMPKQTAPWLAGFYITDYTLSLSPEYQASGNQGVTKVEVKAHQVPLHIPPSAALPWSHTGKPLQHQNWVHWGAGEVWERVTILQEVGSTWNPTYCVRKYNSICILD